MRDGRAGQGTDADTDGWGASILSSLGSEAWDVARIIPHAPLSYAAFAIFGCRYASTQDAQAPANG